MRYVRRDGVASSISHAIENRLRDQATAKIGPPVADAAIRQIGGDRRRDRHVELEPRPANDQANPITPHRETLADARCLNRRQGR